MKRLHTLLLLMLISNKGAAKEYRIMMDTDPLASSLNWLDNWKPTFETHLSKEVSLALGENITFKLFHNDGATPLETIISNKLRDFYFSAPQFAACLEAQYFVRTLVTIRKYMPGGKGESSMFGGAIVASASNTKIQSLADIKGAIVGIEGTYAWGSSLMQQSSLIRHGVHLFRDARQIISGLPTKKTFNQPSILKAIHSGDLDIGFVRADTMYALQSQNLTQLSYFKVLGATNQTFPGTTVPYPYEVSTPLLPDWPLLAFPHVEERMIIQVINALLQLKSTSYPAIRGNYASWKISEVYERVTQVLEDSQLLNLNPASGTRECRWYQGQLADYELFACPPSTFKIPESEAVRKCADMKLECPYGVCWCSPCKQAAQFDVYMQSVDALDRRSDTASICSKMSVCLNLEQGRQFQPIVMDNNFRDERLNVSFRVRNLGSKLAEERSGNLIPDDKVPWTYVAQNLSISTAGLYSFEVFVNSVQIDASPFLLSSMPPTCSHSKVPDENGVCWCAGSDLDIGSSCVNPLVVIAAAVVSFLLLPAVYFCVKSKTEEESEKIIRQSIQGIRERLKITRKDGFVLNTERMLSSKRTVGFIRAAYVEAAARMALLQRFDVKHFDAFCVCLQGEEATDSHSGEAHGEVQEKQRSYSLQYQLLREWLIELAQTLLDPREDASESHVDIGDAVHPQRSQLIPGILRVPRRISALPIEPGTPFKSRNPSVEKFQMKFGQTRSEITVGSSPEQRFRYFEGNVIKLRIWKENSNSLFVELKDVARRLMSEIAKKCDERYSKLIAEKGGDQLVLLASNAATASSPSPKVPMLVRCDSSSSLQGADGIYRQDHEKVQAIRVDSSDITEAALQRNASFHANNSDLDADGVTPLYSSGGLGIIADGLVTILNEEVFLSQLTLRAQLLNRAFQAKILDVIRQFACKENYEAPDEVDSHTGPSQVVALSCMFDGRPAAVEVHPAPIKTLTRMRDKLAKYAPPHPRSQWPLTANILDPVRTSVVCAGPAQILQIKAWFTDNQAANGLAVSRIKNKFAGNAAVVDGYRDLSLSVVFVDESGLGIIGEVQIHDKEMHDLKLQMHKLYKIKRAADPTAIYG